jgi:arylsulfatase A-like enzyme
MRNTSERLAAAHVASLLVCLVITGCGGAEHARGRNIVVVVVDTLRADRVGAVTAHGSLTPFLDDLGRHGVRFAHAYSTSSWTIPSVASLFTSRYPSQHLVRGFDSTLAAGEVTLAKRLRAAGWVTAGFSANPQLQAQHGYGQGFDAWQTFPSFKLRGPELRAACFQWIDAHWHRSSAGPLFLFLQYMEPHAPYQPPAPFRAQAAPDVSDETMRRANDLLVGLQWSALTAADVAALSSLYDGEVAAVDAELRTLFEGLEERGVLDGALVLVTADHGEEFREHGPMAHGFTLYNQAIRVPLVVVGTPFPPGVTVDSNVSLLDVAPTVLGLVFEPAEPRFEGQSLLPVLYGLAPPRDVLAELLASQAVDFRHHAAALVRGDVKLLVSPGSRPEFRQDTLFDLATDPLEAHPNPPATASDELLMRLDLEWTLEQLAQRAGEERHRELTPEQRDRLRALGYVD